MPGMMLNRSKMLIRRATTREHLLKQEQANAETRLNKNLEDTTTYKVKSKNSFDYKFSDANLNHKTVRKCSSSGLVLQEIIRNDPVSQEDNNNNCTLDDQKSSGQEKESVRNERKDQENGNSEKLDNQSYFNVNSLKTGGTSIGLRLGFTIPSYGREENGTQETGSKSAHPKNSYRRSRSCGVLLTLKYVLSEGNKNKCKETNNNNSNNNTKTSSKNGGSKVNSSQSDVDNVKNGSKVPRSRSLLHLALREKKGSLDNTVGQTKRRAVDDMDGVKIQTQTSTERSEYGSEDEGYSELEDAGFGRFTRAFRNSTGDEKDEVDINEINVEKSDVCNSTNSPKENRKVFPLIKPRLLPGASNYKLLKDRGQLSVQSNLNTENSQKFDQECNESKWKVNLEREISHSSESGIEETCSEKTMYLTVKNEPKPLKARRQGNVDPPNIVLPIYTAGNPKLIVKPTKSKRKRRTGENVMATSAQADLVYSLNSEKRHSPQASWRSENFVGFYRNILPPIHHESPPQTDQSESPIYHHHNLRADSQETSQESLHSSFFEKETTSDLKRKLSLCHRQNGSSSGSSFSVEDNSGSFGLSDNNNNANDNLESSLSVDIKAENTPSSYFDQGKEGTGFSGTSDVEHSVTNENNIPEWQHSPVSFEASVSSPDSDEKDVGSNPKEDPEQDSNLNSSSPLSHQSGRDLSPELFSFLTSPNCHRRGGVCEMIEASQGQGLTLYRSVLSLDSVMDWST